MATLVYRLLSGMVPAYLATDCSCLMKVVINCVLPTPGLLSSGRPTATLGTDVLWLALGKRTLATNILSSC